MPNGLNEKSAQLDLLSKLRSKPYLWWHTKKKGNAALQDLIKEDHSNTPQHIIIRKGFKIIKRVAYFINATLFGEWAQHNGMLMLDYFTNYATLHHFSILAAAFVGLFDYPIVYVYLLTDIIYRHSIIRGKKKKQHLNLLVPFFIHNTSPKAVLSVFAVNRHVFLSIAWMLIVFVMVFATVTAITIGELFKADKCRYLYECFSTMLDFG